MVWVGGVGGWVGRQVSVTKVGGVCGPLLASFGGVWGMDVWDFAKVHLQRGARNNRRPPEGRHNFFKIPTFFSFFHIALALACPASRPAWRVSSECK
jgi:hypothetical protein